jgi:hypothetical protein
MLTPLAAIGIRRALRIGPKRTTPRRRDPLRQFDRLEHRHLLTLTFAPTYAIGGGTGTIVAGAVAVDSSGNEVVAGHFTGTVNFGPNNPNPTFLSGGVGAANIFVAKYTKSGLLDWVKGIGSSGSDFATAVALDSSGNVYATGFFTGTVNFSPGSGTHELTSPGNRFDAFVLKVDSSGNFIYATGSTGTTQQAFEEPNAIAVDSSGDAFITGQMSNDLTLGSVTLNAVGAANPFIAKLGPTGTVIWAKNFASTTAAGTPAPTGLGDGIAVDPSGNVYTTGSFLGTFNFNPAGGSTLTSTSASSQDEYVSKLDAAGNFVWAKSGGGSGFDQGDGIVFDPTTSSVFTLGTFQGSANFDGGAASGALQTSFGDSLYLLKLDAGTGAFGLVKNVAVPVDVVNGGAPTLATDGLGRLYIGSSFSGSGSVGAYPVSNNTGASLVFIAHATTDGALGPVATAAASGAMSSGHIAIGPGNTVTYTGNFTSTTHFGSTTLAPNGSSNIFVTSAVFAPTTGDFDGDGRTDTAIYDQTASQFFVLESGGGALIRQFGNPAHVNIPIAGDFDGDGKADVGIYDQTASQFFILESGGGALIRQFGNPAHVNIPVVADYDGDGKADLGIYDQTASEFFVLESGGGALIRQFGNPAHVNIPVAGDFDGDGKADVGIYDQTASQFFILLSGGGAKTPQFGNPAHINVPVAGDFDGDGKADIGIYDQTASQFFVLLSSGGAKTPQFGNPAHTNVPVVGDFDGDGKIDTAIYDQTASQFFILESSGGALTPQFGNPAHTNVPLPSVYLLGLRNRAATRSATLATSSLDFAGTARSFAVAGNATVPAPGTAQHASPASSFGRALVSQSEDKPGLRA